MLATVKHCEPAAGLLKPALAAGAAKAELLKTGGADDIHQTSLKPQKSYPGGPLLGKRCKEP